MKILAYYYPSWHHDPSRSVERWTEWELVIRAKPGFPGHVQPRLPLMGMLDLSRKENVAKQVYAAREYGLDGFVACFYWNRGNTILDLPLKHLFDIADELGDFSIGLMWVNRWPHTNLPIDHDELGDDGLHPDFHDRVVNTDQDDFENLIRHCAQHFFNRKCYLTLNDRPYFAVFSSFQLFYDLNYEVNPVIEVARKTSMNVCGRDLFLCGIAHDAEEWLPHSVEWGLDGITSYVLLPIWDGPFLQDYSACSARANSLWSTINQDCGGIYMPSVTVGWDSSPRGVQLADGNVSVYPWSPVVVGSSPTKFETHLRQAVEFAQKNNKPAAMISSWNEWSEGHILEPTYSEGYSYLVAVKNISELASGHDTDITPSPKNSVGG